MGTTARGPGIDLSGPYPFASADSRCPHAKTAATVVELITPAGATLRRLSCRHCEQGWWEQDGIVLELSHALEVIKQIAACPGRHAHATRPKLRELRSARETDPGRVQADAALFALSVMAN